ncbi:MAG: sensor histidine kinase N-terminal domain-containing protein, partial [Thauera sp.]|nr:sensor histidine kinase N-terminal domain-containing protein [Thauera sp.]
MPTSLRRKLLSSLAAPTGLLLAIAGAVAYGTAKGMVTDAYDHNLLNLAHAIATHVHPEADGLSLSLSSEVEAVLRSDTQDRIYFRVRDLGGRLL